MIDLFGPDLLTVREVSRRLALVGRRASPHSLTRFIRSGRNGVRLEGARVGGRWYTTEAAVNAFFCESSQARRPTPPPVAARALPPAEVARRQREEERAERLGL